MSHFTVLVFGEHPEIQLDPFNEQTEDEEYLIFEDKTQEYIDEFETRVFEGKYIESENPTWVGKTPSQIFATPDEYISRWYGLTPNEEGRFGHVYNPNGKWDWYSLGGRWSGAFKLKKGGIGSVGEPGVGDNEAPEGYVDQAYKKYIDFEGMKADRRKAALRTWAKLEKALAGDPLPPAFSEFAKAYETPAHARDDYNELPVVKRLNKAKLIGFFDDPAVTFAGTKEDFVKRAEANSLSAFAVLKDGEWYEKGTVGWFGTSEDKLTNEEWSLKIMELLDSVDGDTLISLYDCHC